MIVGGQFFQRQFRTKFGKNHNLTIPFEGGMHSFKRQGVSVCVCVFVCIPEIKVGIRTATETITADMLQTVWNELDYRVDVCRITMDAHIEHL